MIDEFIIQALANIPFAVVLVVYLYLDFRQRGKTIESMSKMVEQFTSTLKECCEDE